MNRGWDYCQDRRSDTSCYCKYITNCRVILLEERSFEDALIYMVNIFAGRDPPWRLNGNGTGVEYVEWLQLEAAEVSITNDSVNGIL